jgi:hypothetical protein
MWKLTRGYGIPKSHSKFLNFEAQFRGTFPLAHYPYRISLHSCFPL